MKTTKIVLKSLVVLGAALALVACGSKKEAASTSSSAAKTVVLKDGTYQSESGKDKHGYRIFHTLTVKNGKISESKFDYKAEDGSLKSMNEEYNKNMKDKAGVSASEAIKKLNAALVEKQELLAVEVVSGATHTSEDFKKSTEALLKAAAEGKTETVKLDK